MTGALLPLSPTPDSLLMEGDCFYSIENSNVAPPKLRNQPAPDLRIKGAPHGHWRNKFHSIRDAVFGNGAVHKAGEWFSPSKWPSRDVAETRAQQHMIEFEGWVHQNGITYLGPVFFPAEGEGQ